MRRALCVAMLAALFAGGASAGVIEAWLRSQAVTPAADCASRVIQEFGRDRRIPIAVLEAALEDEMACRQNRRRAWDLEQLLQELRG